MDLPYMWCNWPRGTHAESVQHCLSQQQCQCHSRNQNTLPGDPKLDSAWNRGIQVQPPHWLANNCTHTHISTPRQKKNLSRGKNAGDNHCFFVHDRVRDSHYSITLLMTPVFTMRGDMREKAHIEVKMKDFQVNLQSKMGSEKTQSWLVY